MTWLGFFLADKLNRASVAAKQAIAFEGAVVERLERTLGSVMQAMAEHPALSTEVPGAITETGKLADAVTGADRLVLAPFRDLLIEGEATGELVIPDVNTQRSPSWERSTSW